MQETLLMKNRYHYFIKNKNYAMVVNRRIFIPNDDLQDLMYDITKNQLSKFENILISLNINYDKSIFDIFVKVFRFIFIIGVLLFGAVYAFLVYFYATIMPTTSIRLVGIILIFMFVFYFCFYN